jgi:hypothetical protein
VAVAGADHVVAEAADQPVGAGPAVDVVVAGPSKDGVSTVIAVDLVAGPTGDAVVALASAMRSRPTKSVKLVS